MLSKIKLAYFKIKYKKALIIGRHFSARRGIIFEIVGNGKVKIGDNCFMNNYCSVNCLDSIEIGDNCLFGENVKIYDHNHKFNERELIRKQGFSVKNVKIGNNIWIGTNAVILAGTVIEDNCVIGAGVIVSGKIPFGSVIKNNSVYNLERIHYK